MMNPLIRIPRRTRLFCAGVIFTSLATMLAMPAMGAPAVSTAHDAAADAPLVAQIAAHLGRLQGVHAQFVQTQTSAALKQPLASTGTLAFFREQGVIWHVDTPYRATYVMTDAGVAAFDANGKRLASGRANGNLRGVAQVSKMMRAMLGGDLSALYAQFSVQAEGTSAQWRMTLTPSQPQLAQVMRSLRMSGGDYLTTLHITFAHGNTMQIDFSHSRPALAPTDAERAWLVLPASLKTR